MKNDFMLPTVNSITVDSSFDFFIYNKVVNELFYIVDYVHTRFVKRQIIYARSIPNDNFH